MYGNQHEIAEKERRKPAYDAELIDKGCWNPGIAVSRYTDRRDVVNLTT